MDLNHDNDWHRYFGDSTVYISGKSGLSVHLPDSGKPSTEDRERIQTETQGGSDAVRKRLGQNHGDDKT